MVRPYATHAKKTWRYRGLAFFALCAIVLSTIVAVAANSGQPTLTPPVVHFQAALAGCTSPPGTFSITVCGNKWENQTGNEVVLRGANTEGTQYDCAQSGSGFFDDSTVSVSGTTVTATTEINAMKAWGINVVRVNLNEECWLGINGVPSTTSGTDVDGYDHYANVIGSYVSDLNAAGIYAEVDLHLNAPGTELITDASGDFQNPLPDATNSVNFWHSVGAFFSSNRAVILGAFNEPFPNNYNSNGDSSTFWNDTVNGATIPHDCTSSGGNCSGGSYTADGMSQMITAIRADNTTAPILVGGPDFAGDMDDWLSEYYPSGVSIDPDNLLAASVHIYYTGASAESPCSASTSIATACQTGAVGDTASSALVDTAATTPVLIDEIGNFTCTNSASLTSLLGSVDTYNAAHGTDIGWVGWSWTTSSCDPNMITNFTTGAPRAGQGVAMYCNLYLNGMNPGTLTSPACTGTVTTTTTIPPTTTTTSTSTTTTTVPPTTTTTTAPPSPTSSIIIPNTNTAVSGSMSLLDVAASNATTVKVQIFGGIYGFYGPFVCTTTPTLYGWLCYWNTTSVPNGFYTLLPWASNATSSAYGTGINIAVAN